MASKHLPVFRIQDFDAPAQREQYFYLNRFADHLREHRFIQRPHRHNFFIMLLITSGTGTHTIDFETYPVKPHTVYFLSPGQVHHWQLSADTDGYILFFSPDFYLLGHPQQKLYSFPFFRALLHRPLLEISEADQARLLPVVQLLEEEYRLRQAQREEVLRDLLDVLLIRLSRRYNAQGTAAAAPLTDLAPLQGLENLISGHYREHRPVSFYAEALHLTARQLNDLSKRTLGKTVTELVQDRLLLEARRLLVHAPLTVSQVAAELGIFDNSYFSRFFKKHLGQTPEQFRTSHGANSAGAPPQV